MTFASNISLSKNWARYFHIYICVCVCVCVYVCKYMHARTHTHTGLHVQYALFLSDVNDTWICLTNFAKVNKILWKSFQWEPSCSILTDGQTAMKNIILVCCCLSKETRNLRLRTTQSLPYVKTFFRLTYERLIQIMVKLT
jgi:hypothetical protein